MRFKGPKKLVRIGGFNWYGGHKLTMLGALEEYAKGEKTSQVPAHR